MAVNAAFRWMLRRWRGLQLQVGTASSGNLFGNDNLFAGAAGAAGAVAKRCRIGPSSWNGFRLALPQLWM